MGPNGAGKSTTMKMLTGYLRPTRGTVKIWGCDMWQDPLTAQTHIGYLPEGAPAYEEMSVAGFLGFIGEVRGFSGEGLVTAVAAAAHTMSLHGVMDQRIETLSKGYKRRVGLAQAILHDPDVLVLDEPTDGLDPNQKHQVREMIKGLSRDKIVIVSTHILEEVTAVCNRAVVLSAGRIVADTTPDALLAQSRYHGAISLTLRAGDAQQLAGKLRQLTGVSEVDVAGEQLQIFPVRDAELLQPVLDACEGSDIADIVVEQGRLDEVFRNLTEGRAQ